MAPDVLPEVRMGLLILAQKLHEMAELEHTA
jgi:hypothetical protein